MKTVFTFLLPLVFITLPFADKGPRSPTTWERDISKKVYTEITKNAPSLRNTGLRRYFQTHLQAFRPFLYRTRMNWTVVALNSSDVINAAALPNGKILFYSGMLHYMPRDAWIGILAHEVGHVELAHSHRQNRRNEQVKTASAGVGMCTAVGCVLAGALAGVYVDPRGVYRSTAGLSASLLLPSVFSYSRKLELEADFKGFELLEMGGYEPIIMISALNRSDFTEMDLFTPRPKYLTHPKTAYRLNRLLEEYVKRDFAFQFMDTAWSPELSGEEWVFKQNERTIEMPAIHDFRVGYVSKKKLEGRTGYYYMQKVFGAYDMEAYFKAYARPYYMDTHVKVVSGYIKAPKKMHPEIERRFDVYKKTLIAEKGNRLNIEFLKNYRNVLANKIYESIKKFAEANGFIYVGPRSRLTGDNAVDVTGDLIKEMKWLGERKDRFVKK
jgi:Zn-dependent protease with chaperone function